MLNAIDAPEAHRILESPNLIEIGVRADEVRRQMHGQRTTFVRVFEVHADAVPATLPENTAPGELRVIGRPASAESAREVVRSAARIAGNIPVTGFALADLLEIGGASFVDFCTSLRDAGLYAVSEVQVDRLGQASADAVVEARTAGLGVTRLTVESLVPADRVDVVLRARELQERVGGFRLFAPLPRTWPVSAPSTGYDDVKQVAIARLLGTGIESIQVDWALYGPKLAQFALTIGADDVDAVAPGLGTLGTRRSPLEEIRGNIRSAALEPVERNARYEAIG
jgi:hypothetical protein